MSLNNTCYNILFLCNVLIVKDFSFGFSEFLNNNLFCCLGRNSAEVSRCDNLVICITYMILRAKNSCFHNRHLCNRVFYMFYYFFLGINSYFSCFTVHFNLHILRRTEIFLACRNKSRLYCFKNNFLVNAFFFFDNVKSLNKFSLIIFIHFLYTSLENYCQTD